MSRFSAAVRLSLVCLIGAGCHGNATPTVGTNAASASLAPEISRPEVRPSLIEGYDFRVLARGGQPVAGEKSKVTKITHWSLNAAGHVAFIAEKSATGGDRPQDLFFFDGNQSTCLLSQRRTGPYKLPRVWRLDGVKLNDRGEMLVAGCAGQNQHPCLWLVTKDRAELVARSEHVVADPHHIGGQANIILGNDRQLLFVVRDPSKPLMMEVMSGTVGNVQSLFTAGRDASRPTRQFSGFHILWARNSRGDLVFDGSIPRDSDSGLRLFHYGVRGSEPRGAPQVREILHPGARIKETSLYVQKSPGTIWGPPVLSERGDVALRAAIELITPPAGGRQDPARVRPSEMKSQSHGGILVLPAGSNDWKVLVREGDAIGKERVVRVSDPGINDAGQIAVALRIDGGAEHYYKLVRFKADESMEELAREGQVPAGIDAKDSRSIYFSDYEPPMVLPSGRVIFSAALRQPGERPGQSRLWGLFIADGKEVRKLLHWPAEQMPEIAQRLPQIEKIQVNRAGQMGLLVPTMASTHLSLRHRGIARRAVTDRKSFAGQWHVLKWVASASCTCGHGRESAITADGGRSVF